MKGYHYTPLKTYRKIEIEGLLPMTLFESNILELSKDTEGVWLYLKPQERESLFGLLVDRWVKWRQWKIVELEVNFEIEDCLRAIEEGDTLELTHRGSMGGWVYHENEPIIIISNVVSSDRIQLRRQFNLLNMIKEE